MTTTQDRHENLASAEYLDAMSLAWSVVKDLHKAGVPVERLVWRARALYHAAWQDEKRRMVEMLSHSHRYQAAVIVRQ